MAQVEVYVVTCIRDHKDDTHTDVVAAFEDPEIAYKYACAKQMSHVDTDKLKVVLDRVNPKFSNSDKIDWKMYLNELYNYFNIDPCIDGICQVSKCPKF